MAFPSKIFDEIDNLSTSCECWGLIAPEISASKALSWMISVASFMEDPYTGALCLLLSSAASSLQIPDSLTFWAPAGQTSGLQLLQ